jgi:acetolactate synthase I/II/III large subunit
MAETKLAETVVEYLSSQNVRHIFGVLAHTSFELGDAIAKRSQLRFINAQHEGGAGNMALGYARAAKKPAVCLVSAGGGATNIVTAVAQAYKESVPLFVISSDINMASSSKGAWSSYHGMEHVRLFEPITKQSLRLERVEEIGSVLDSLFHLTTRGRQGPVFFIIPADLQAASLPEPLTFSQTANPAAPAIDSRSAEMAADLLLKANAPVVLVGTGVDWSGAQKEVQELAELLSLPVAASYTAKGVFPESHPMALGCLGAGSRPYARKFFLESDVILALGTTFSEGTTLGFGNRIIPSKAKIIQIDIDPDELGRNYPTQLAVQADVKTALRAIIDAVKNKGTSTAMAGRSRRAQEIQEGKQAWQNELGKKTAGEGMTYDSVLKTLNELLTGKETLVTAGMTGDLLRNIDAATPIIHAGEFRAIGTAFATSLGVKLGLPDRRVVCVTGDGSFMMEQQELATARLHNIPVLNIVLHNNAYGGMKRDQLNHYNGRVIGTELFVPDLARLAELFGAKGHTVTRPEEVRPTLQKSLESDDFVVVDVKVDK